MCSSNISLCKSVINRSLNCKKKKMFSYILDSPDSRKSTGPEQITKSSHNNKNQEQKGLRTFFFHVPPWTLVKGWKGAMWKGWDVQAHGWPAHKVHRVEKEQKGVDSLKEPSVRKTHPEKGVERVYVWLWTCTRVGKVYRGTCGRRIACRVSGVGMTRSFFFFFSPFTLIIDAALRNDGIVSCELGIRTLRNERKSWSSWHARVYINAHMCTDICRCSLVEQSGQKL